MRRLSLLWSLLCILLLAPMLAKGQPTPATLTPSSGTLSTSQTFSWANGVGATDYRLLLSTRGPGYNELFGSGVTNRTDLTIAIPANGVTVFVRLYQEIGGVWQYTDYTFTESGTTVPATLTPSSGILSTSQTFTWSNGAGPVDYILSLGTAAKSSNIYYSKITTATSVTVPIPANGKTVYATLQEFFDGAWSVVYQYTFTEPVAPPPGYEVNLTWDAPTGSSDPVTGYNVYRTVEGGSTYSLVNPAPNTTTAYSDTAVQSGTSYTYYVESVDAEGNQSVPSNSVTISVP